MSKWVFIDDQPEPAAAFADALGGELSGLAVEVLSPWDAREQILPGKLEVDGILMDVDLSDLPGEHGSGPGLAQDIRIQQENGTVKPFPIIRFAYQDRVARNIGGDASSDDLFDLKINKEFAAHSVETVRRKLHGCRSIYDGVGNTANFGTEALSAFLGLSPERLEILTSSEFITRAEAARSDKPHVAAGLIMRFLTQPGPLIDESLLSVRLGVHLDEAPAEPLVNDLLGITYSGCGREHFKLYWSRGLEEWWLEEVGADAPLASMTILQRGEILGSRYPGIRSVEMPPESLGNRPWRLCTLSLEDGSFIPVDPAFGIRVTPRGNLAPWVDPAYAALGIALEKKNDPRLSKQDLARHSMAWES